MYQPQHFIEHDTEAQRRIMVEHPLGMLVTHGAQGLDADHLPFELDGARGPHGTLLGHVARANPLWQAAAGQEVMVVFRAAQGYISPSWYPSKHETHRLVPTWNYEVVHAHGRLRVIDDQRFVRGIVARLTRHHEAGEARPWKMGDAPADFIDQLLAAIVGIEIEITHLACKRKLSQNRDARDLDGAIRSLGERGAVELSGAMQQARP
ncbi:MULTISPECIES: FMN-binding negative transcriptional regulator [unclassified Variovorax]|uniref:FMN-binding negative transcriptional regulator n=1 Tax=unclassified Variovorax TaxID=663243 RepID=UPI0025756B93|nr:MULTISPECIES: FMN-binding negative transcriptional regulator [unclassified Variovorax]MDM0087243.1 FMN-binding negative transcriptional regulator [Variovorax sp. J22G40]MDM0144500.1 FMN-binding negative transcriptional regulator [Variovorax sp. J2P1-31]